VFGIIRKCKTRATVSFMYVVRDQARSDMLWFQSFLLAAQLTGSGMSSQDSNDVPRREGLGGRRDVAAGSVNSLSV
jgi:hypothetical protein